MADLDFEQWISQVAGMRRPLMLRLFMRPPIITTWGAICAVALALATASTAVAGDAGLCCSDLDQRVMEFEQASSRSGNRAVRLTISGQVNEAIMFWDDGLDHGRFFVTDRFERTRFRFAGESRKVGDVSAGFLLEFGARGYNATTRTEIRHSAWWLDHAAIGRVWVGHTSSATDGITEINLANVNADVLNVSQWNPTFRLRNGNNTLSFLTWNSITPGFRGFWVPGEGDRNNVVKYVSPTLAGFTLSAAWGDDDFWDIALRYAHQFGDVRLAAGIGYKQQNDSTDKTGSDGPACTDLSVSNQTSAVDCHSVGLSASIMHMPTGLFATGSWGKTTDKNRKALFGGIPGIRDEDEHRYFQGGIERDWLGFGRTTVYAELGHYTAGAALGGFGPFAIQGGLGSLASSEVEVRGFGVNQAIDAAAMDIYLAHRIYSADVRTSATGSEIGSNRSPLQDFKATMVGAVIRF